jgi:lysozyme family protein
MSKSTFDAVAPWLLAHEGGFVNHPKDPGGATNMGITIGTLSAWRGNRVTVEAVRDLTKDEALRIYRRQYWGRCARGRPPGRPRLRNV